MPFFIARQTVQLVIFTDGQISFAAFNYDDLASLKSLVVHNDIVIIGFDAGNARSSANLTNFILESSEADYVFRIDGN